MLLPYVLALLTKILAAGGGQLCCNRRRGGKPKWMLSICLQTTSANTRP
jgi:hypothetical protein